ncbi:MAG: hypothetical protein DHS20C16_01640 [Phycisphaerae bacterium]|nr:MAG: hypothetical protein DHS20C16_01640 [Phycisphaerae bacterium]
MATIMEPFKTVSTVERLVRNGIVTAMVIGFAGWSFYDGYVGYPNDNLEQAKLELPAEQQHTATINERVTEEVADTFKKGINVKEISDAFGPPAWQGDTGGPREKAVWFGRGGSLIARVDKIGIARNFEWKSGKHKETDLWLQKLMGLVLAPFGLYMLFRLIAMSTRGAEFSEEGLKPSGQALIPFDAMTGWDAETYKDRGQITLDYETSNGKGQYVLDDYKLAAFKTIVNEISKRKGFDNPIKTDETTTEAQA